MFEKSAYRFTSLDNAPFGIICSGICSSLKTPSPSPRKTRTAFTLRMPASCGLKSIQSDSPWALSPATLPCSCSAAWDSGGGDLLLAVGARVVADHFLLPLALLLCQVLRIPRGFLVAIGLAVHVSARFSSCKAGRDEQCLHLFWRGHFRFASLSQFSYFTHIVIVRRA